MKRLLPLLAAALVGGCAETPPLKPWPASMGRGEGAVLFGADTSFRSDAEVDFEGFAVDFLSADALRPLGWVVLSEPNAPGPIDNVFLVALPAGDYAGTRLEAKVLNKSRFVPLPGEGLESFSVLPGEVTVLGVVKASIVLRRLDGGRIELRRDAGADVSAEARTKLLRDALARWTAASPWTAALNDALGKTR